MVDCNFCVLVYVLMYDYYFVCVQYEDPVRQDAARKTVPKDELEEKALVSLAKVCVYVHRLIEL